MSWAFIKKEAEEALQDHGDEIPDHPLVNIYRYKSTDQGTEGRLIFNEEGFECYTFELPWRNNQSNISCIPSSSHQDVPPPGLYTVQIRISPRYGRIYWVSNVPDRQWCLIHSGNYAGDVQQGFKTHVKGCILLGKYFGWLEKQRAVLVSRPTVRKFMSIMGGRTS